MCVQGRLHISYSSSLYVSFEKMPRKKEIERNLILLINTDFSTRTMNTCPTNTYYVFYLNYHPASPFLPFPLFSFIFIPISLNHLSIRTL